MNENLEPSKKNESSDYSGLSAGFEIPREVYRFPTDWWHCLRFGSVSGRYEGKMTSPNAGKYELDLRVDIDRQRPLRRQNDFAECRKVCIGFTCRY